MKEGETAPAEGCYKSCKAIRRNIFYWMQDNVVRTASAFSISLPTYRPGRIHFFSLAFKGHGQIYIEECIYLTLTFFFPKTRPTRAQAKATCNGDKHPASLQDNKGPIMY
jgi:hypothetical protein